MNDKRYSVRSAKKSRPDDGGKHADPSPIPEESDIALMDRATRGLIRYERRKRRVKRVKRLALLLIAVASCAGIAYWGQQYAGRISWIELRDVVDWSWQQSLDPGTTSRPPLPQSDDSLHSSGLPSASRRH